MDGKLTVREVLEITVNNLQGIMLPVELSETAGQTILGSIRNLTACINAMDRQESENDDGGESDGSEADAE